MMKSNAPLRESTSTTHHLHTHVSGHGLCAPYHYISWECCYKLDAKFVLFKRLQLAIINNGHHWSFEGINLLVPLECEQCNLQNNNNRNKTMRLFQNAFTHSGDKCSNSSMVK